MSQQPPTEPGENLYRKRPSSQLQLDEHPLEDLSSSAHRHSVHLTPRQFQRPHLDLPPSKKQFQRPSINLSAERPSGIRQWFQSHTKRARVSIVLGIMLAVVVLFAGIGTAIGSVKLGRQSTIVSTMQPQPTATGTGSIVTSTLAPQPTSTPALTPSPIPTATPSPTPYISKIRLGWSIGYYVGWLQNSYPPQAIPWKDFTHIIDFSLKTNRDGSLMYSHGLTPTTMQALVTEAHTHNVKALLSIGGDDDQNWDGACSAASRTTFVNNLVSTMQTYGYDGLDLDIEQDFGYPNYTDYTACIQQLRGALDKVSPRPMLTMAVIPEWQAYQASHAWQYVDQLNMMSYGTDATGIGKLINNFTSRGFPKSKLGIGIDFVAHANATWCGGLAQYTVNNKVGGLMEWDIAEDQAQNNGQTPCLNAISGYVPSY